MILQIFRYVSGQLPNTLEDQLRYLCRSMLGRCAVHSERFDDMEQEQKKCAMRLTVRLDTTRRRIDRTGR